MYMNTDLSDTVIIAISERYSYKKSAKNCTILHRIVLIYSQNHVILMEFGSGNPLFSSLARIDVDKQLGRHAGGFLKLPDKIALG